MPSDQVSIEGLDRAAVLAALYNASRPQGMGFLQYDPKPMTVEEARQLLGPEPPLGEKYFDYLKGRVMKVDLSRDTLNLRLYDRDNGTGTGERVINQLRETQDTNAATIRATHRNGVKNAAAEAVESMNTLPTQDGSVITLTLSDMKDHLAPKVNEAVEQNQ